MTKTGIIGTEEDNVYERGKALAEKVNREAELEEKEAARQARLDRKKQKKSVKEQPPKLERNLPLYLDKEPWSRRNKTIELTQGNWISKYNEAGKVMACAADFYKAAQLGDKAIASVQEDFDPWIITSTRIIYNKDNLEGKIIHYCGSSIIKPVERKILIPDYSGGKPFKNILDTAEGLKFVQVLFLTDDSKEEILETLRKLSDKKEDELNIWAPPQDKRKVAPQRAVSFSYMIGDFHVDAGSYPEGSNKRSRGVNFPSKENQEIAGMYKELLDIDNRSLTKI